MARRVVVGVAVVVAVVSAVVSVFRSEAPTGYTSDEVVAAFREQGLVVAKVAAADGTPYAVGGSYVAPANGRYTILVLASNSVAEDAFKQFEIDTDPETFELRDQNMIVIADGSNSSDPLPQRVRAQIRAAVNSLREAHAS